MHSRLQPTPPLILFAFLASSIVIQGCSPEPPAPFDGNVLLITIDTLRPDYMSFNGYDRETTPFLNALLSQGWYYEQALAPVPRTTPALASLLTGAYPHTTGVRTLTDSLADGVVTITEVMRQAGYQTTAVVTNHLLVEERGLNRAFDIYDMAWDYRLADRTTDAAEEQLARLDPNRPVFAWIHYIDPHVPYQTDPDIARAIDPGYEGRYRLNFGWIGYPGATKRPNTAFPEDLPKEKVVHRNDLPDEVNAHIRRLYAADIMSMNDHLMRLVSGFRDRFGDDLIIVFTADHGESLGEHDFHFDHGDYVYNASSLVPLAFVLPPSHRFAGSGRCSGWVSLVDVVPTLLDLIGREASPAMSTQVEGRSLTACMEGRPIPERPVFVESGDSFFPEQVRRRVRNDVAGRFRAVVRGDFKLIWTPFLPESEAWELYHLLSDPEEIMNLYHAGSEEAARLKLALKAWMAGRDQEGSEREVTEEDLDALRSLGYVN